AGRITRVDDLFRGDRVKMRRGLGAEYEDASALGGDRDGATQLPRDVHGVMRAFRYTQTTPDAAFGEHPDQGCIRSDSNCICRADSNAGQAGHASVSSWREDTSAAQAGHARVSIDHKIHEAGLSQPDSGHPKIAIRLVIVK